MARAMIQGIDEDINLGPAPEMERLTSQLRAVARLDTTILLSGETGTGKTRLARLIHEHSPRRDEPFLVVNCGALSSNLIESEMFGHVRGSFTGADRDRVGKFAEVGKGTLLLDEIDSLPISVQAKLLRVVEDRIFEAVGSNTVQPVRARLVAACNRPLEGEVAAGRFRPDLYYRLNVVGFHLPPLRERPRAVVRMLAERFIAEFAERLSRPITGLTLEAAKLLEGHDWPGNVRELRNLIERAVALSDGDQIHADDLPTTLHRPGHVANGRSDEHATTVPLSLARVKMEAEKAQIAEALERHGNNRLRAAAALGVSRMTLYKKLHKYGMTKLA